MVLHFINSSLVLFASHYRSPGFRRYFPRLQAFRIIISIASDAMAQFQQLPLEVVRMILQELYTIYCKEGDIAWSFSDAMKVHPVWQAIGDEIIHEEIGRIVKQSKKRPLCIDTQDRQAQHLKRRIF